MRRILSQTLLIGLAVGLSYGMAEAGSINLQLSHEGDWGSWHKQPRSNTTRQVSIELYNPSTARLPGTHPPYRARWQLRCAAANSPHVTAFAANDPAMYPGGEIPGPRQRLRIKIVLQTSRASHGILLGFPAEPYELQLGCKLHVGAFLPGQHPPTAGKSKSDYSPAPGIKLWQDKSFLLTIKNADSLKRPADVSLDALQMAGDKTMRDPLQGGREFWTRLTISQNAGLTHANFVCELSRSQRRVKVTNGTVGFPPTQPGQTVSGVGYTNFGAQPKGNYAVQCRLLGLPRGRDANSANNVVRRGYEVRGEIAGRGPDLAVTGLDVRDGDRLSLVSPTAGSRIVAHVDLENRGTADSDRHARVTCSASQRGRTLGKAAVTAGVIKRSGRKTVAVPLPAVRAGSRVIFLCVVDADGDPDIGNNGKSVQLNLPAPSSQDFAVTLTTTGRDWAPWSQRRTHNHRRQFSLKLRNRGARGPAAPHRGGKVELRWQAHCSGMWCSRHYGSCGPAAVTFSAADDSGRHPGGALPAGADEQSVSVMVETHRQKARGINPSFRDEGRYLLVTCNVKTGPFFRGQLPGGGAKSANDYSLAPGQKPWSQQMVRIRVENTDGR